MNTPNKVAIIGAGPSGLIMGRALKRAGIEFDIFEKHSEVGGIWDMNNEGTPMYESAHFISSKTLSGFPDFPMPDTFPDFPSRKEVFDYIRAFAKHYSLYPNIRFNSLVSDIRKITDDHWNVITKNGESFDYQSVVCANGTTWHPTMAQYEGHFSGEIRHSNTYKKTNEFSGKRVLIVGAGNSGVDIACDAAANSEKAYWSMRRGYHILPKQVFGKPSDVFENESPRLPLKITQWSFTILLKLLVGDITKYGFPKPDHKILESHPILNSQIIHHAAHGNITIKPDISHFEGKEVVFKDGSREAMDLVLMATGYDMLIPYIDNQYFEWKNGRPQLFLSCFNPKQDNLYGIGYLEANSAGYTILTHHANMIANYMLDKKNNPAKAAAFRKRVETEKIDLSGGIQFINSNRHTGYVDGHTFSKILVKIHKSMQWEIYKPGFFDAK